MTLIPPEETAHIGAEKPVAVSGPAGTIGYTPAQPQLVLPSASYVVLGATGPQGAAAPTEAGPYRNFVRADDLLVLRATTCRNGNGQIFIAFDFPAQHASESSPVTSQFTKLPPPDLTQPPQSAGPFGWIGSDEPTLLPLDGDTVSYLTESPGPGPTPTILWWNDLRLPGTSLLFLVPGLTAMSPEPIPDLLSGDVTTVLDWSKYILCIAPKAPSTGLWEHPPSTASGAQTTFPAPTPPAASDAEFGALGMMFGMVFTPTELGAWTHINLPKSGMTGRTELWHTRLVSAPGAAGAVPTMRAAWSLSHAIADAISEAKLTPLTNAQFPNQYPLVNEPAQGPVLYQGIDLPETDDLSALFALKYPGNTWVEQPITILTGSLAGATAGHDAMRDLVTYTNYNPAAGTTGVELPAEDVLLSTAGGSLRTGADFTSTNAVKPDILLSFQHEQHLGRDLAAKSDLAAHLAPFGQSVIIGETYQRIVSGSATGEFAEIRAFPESVQIVQRSAVMPSNADFTQPFQSITLVTKVIPPVDRDENGICYPDTANGKSSQPFMAQYEATDVAGNTLSFQLPLQVLGAGQAASPTYSIVLNQQRVAYSKATNSTFQTDAITLAVSLAGGGPLSFSVQDATIRHPALSQFANSEQITITPPPAGAGNDTLAAITPPASGPLRVDGSTHTDRFGAFAAPQIPSLTVLSKQVGAAGAPVPASSAANGLDAVIGAIFGDTMLLGVFSLADLVTGFAKDLAPNMSLPMPGITSTNDAGTVTVTMVFPSDGGTAGSAEQPLTLSVGSIATLSVGGISFSSTTVHGPGGTTSTGVCTLTSPSIMMPVSDSLVSVSFNTMTFTSSSAAKPTAAVDFNAIEFMNQLGFVNTIMEILPSSLFSNPPEVTITDSQCLIDCGVDFPSIGIGVFELANINLDAALTIPFVVEPISFSFDFSTPDDPFTLSVMGFAGSGSFGITISANAVTVNGSLAFGGSYALDVIVAQGYVTLQAGVHITYTSSTDSATPSDLDVGGFVHLSGGVSVLDLVGVSLDVMLSLTYDTASNGFSGSADVSLSVDLLMFHKSVSFSVSETFSGSAPPADASTEILVAKEPAGAIGTLPGGSHPRNPFAPVSGFLSGVTADDWNQYCSAFVGAAA